LKSIIRSRFTIMKKENEQWLVDVKLLEPFERDVLLRLDKLPGDGVNVVKTSMSRTVLHLPQTDDRPGLYLKCHRQRNMRERLLDLLRPSRAEREFNNLLRFEHYALPAPRAIALGQVQRKGEPVRRYLAVEEVTGAKLLPDIIAGKNEQELLALCSDLGKWIAGIHQSGADHRDLQPGNILIRPGEGQERFVLIDLHSLRFDPVMPEHARARALAALAGYLEMAVGMRGFGSFSGAYMKAAHLEFSFAAKLQDAIESARSRRFRSRTARCLVNSSKFIIENSNRRRVYRRRDLHPEALDKITEARNGKSENVTVLSESAGARSKAVRVTLEGKEQIFFVKEFSKPTLAQSLRALFIGPRARREYRAGHGFSVRGISAPEVKACIEGGDFDLLVTEFIENGEQLNNVVHRLFVANRFSGKRDDLKRQRKFIRALADEIRHMHDAGVYHPDLKAKNILVTEEGSTWRFLFVDLADVRFKPPSTRRIIKNLMQLNAGIPYCIGDGLRARFFLRYLRGEKRVERSAMLEEIIRGSSRRVERWRRQIEKAGKRKSP